MSWIEINDLNWPFHSQTWFWIRKYDIKLSIWQFQVETFNPFGPLLNLIDVNNKIIKNDYYGLQFWTFFVLMRHSDCILFYFKYLEFTLLNWTISEFRTVYLLLFGIYFGIFVSDYIILIFCIYILIFSFRIDLISFFRPFLILEDWSHLSTLIRVLFLVLLWSFKGQSSALYTYLFHYTCSNKIFLFEVNSVTASKVTDMRRYKLT